MAIKIQVKDTQTFDRAPNAGNGRFVNNSVVADPRTTTASNGCTVQSGITDPRPSFGCPVTRMMNLGMQPFAHGLNTFVPSGLDAFGRFAPAFAAGSNLPSPRTAPFRGWTAPTTFGSSTMKDFVPMDIYENDQEYILLAELPGASVEDVDILVEGRSLTITGSIKPPRWAEGHRTLLQETSSFKSIERTVMLGSEVRIEGLDAALAEGILTLRVPKPDAGCTSTRRVTVAAA